MEWNLNRSEVLRYMGYAGQDDEHIVQTAQTAMDRLTAIAQPRYHYINLPLDAMELPGEDIRRHLAGCDSMYLLCATLGAAVDREIRLAERVSMLNALALDAAAGDGIEKVCDYAQEEIRAREAQKGRFITGRFSPGYGDLPMTVQPVLLRLCDAPRKIGLSLTQSGILIPRKSVTAILGASSVPVEGKRRGCGTCSMTASCPFRKRGITCGS
jgi:hypothetical protein